MRRIRQVLQIYLSLAFVGYPSVNASDVPKEEAARPELNHLLISNNFGEIVEVFDQKKGPFVILIEDPHALFEAQKNIERLLRSIFEQWGSSAPRAVLLEGAVGELDTTPFEGISQDLREDVLGILMRLGEISGAEFYALTAVQAPDVSSGESFSAVLTRGSKPRVSGDPEDRPLTHTLHPKLWGVEDPSLYRANLEVFRQVTQTRERNLRDLSKRKQDLLKFLGPRETAFLMRWDDFQDGKISLKDFLKSVLPLAQKNNIEISSKSQLNRFVIVMEEMESWDYALIQSEMKKIIEQISSRASGKELRRVVEQTLAYRLKKISDKEFSEILNQSMNRLGIRSELYRHFKKFRSTLKEIEVIDFLLLHEEIQVLAREIAYGFSSDEESHNLVRQWETLMNWERLLRLDWTRSEFLNHQEHPPQELAPAMQFYQLALERDRALAKNTLTFLKKNPLKSAALVVGGFHREGLTQIFKEQGISYVVLRPRFSGNLDSHHYEDLLLKRPGKLLESLSFSVRLAVPSRLMNALSRIEDVQRFNILLALYHMVCSSSWDIDSNIEAAQHYRGEKGRWLKYLENLLNQLVQSSLSDEEVQIRKSGLEHLIRTIRFFDLDFSGVLKMKESLYVPVLLKREISKTEPLWVQYLPKQESVKPRGLEELAEVLDEQELRHHTIRFVKGPRVEMGLAELIAGLLSEQNRNLDNLMKHFWEKDIIEQWKPTQEQVFYWEKLIGEFAKEVFPQKDRPIIEVISNAITSVWKREGEGVPQSVKVVIGSQGFRVMDQGGGMSLYEILSKLLVPGLSGTRGTEGIGQFGVGFYSILRYLFHEDDRVTVTTNDGKNAHRVMFFLEDQKIKVRISPLPPLALPEGTEVHVEISQKGFFDQTLVEKTARDAFRFLRRGKIIVNGQVVNEKAMDFQEYLGLRSERVSKDDFLTKTGLNESLWTQLVEKGYLSLEGELQSKFDGDRVQFLREMHQDLGRKASSVFRILKEAQIGKVFFSKWMAWGGPIPGKGMIYVVKDEVVLFSLETQGWAIPGEMVIRVPKFIRIPVERDKIEIGPLERDFFRSMIDLISQHPDAISMLSAFYPLVERLQQWNPSPEKEEDLLRYFFQKVRAQLLRTDAVLPDQEEFHQVNAPGVKYLHPQLYLRFEDSGVRLPQFQPLEGFRPKDWRKRIFLAPFKNSMQGIVKFGRLVLLSDHLKPNTLIEKALVYTLLNYYVTDPQKNIPGYFAESLPTRPANFSFGKEEDLEPVVWVQDEGPAGVRRELWKEVFIDWWKFRKKEPVQGYRYFTGNQRLLKLILRRLLERGNASLSLSGLALDEEPDVWKKLSEDLAKKLDQVIIASEGGSQDIRLNPFLKSKHDFDLLLKKEDLESYLKEAPKDFQVDQARSLGKIVSSGPFGGTNLSQWGFLQLGKISVDENGTVYVFDREMGNVVKFRGTKLPQMLRLNIQGNQKIYDLEVSPDGKEFYLANGELGVLILDETGKFKTPIDTRLLGERISSESEITKIKRVGKDTLILWDRKRRSVLILKRAGLLANWQFVRIVHSTFLSSPDLEGDRTGNIYVLDTALKKVHIYDPSGHEFLNVDLSEGKPQKPIALHVDTQGSLWILDELKGALLKYTCHGKFLGEYGKAVDPDFWAKSSGMAFMPDRGFLIANSNLNQIRRFQETPSNASVSTPSRESRLAYLQDLAFIGFLEAYLKDQSGGTFLPAKIGSLFKDPERWALVESWFDLRGLTFQEAQWDLRTQYYLDFLFQMFLVDLGQIPFDPSSVQESHSWVEALTKIMRASPLSNKWAHPEDFRFWVAYYKIRRNLSDELSRRHFDRFFQQSLQGIDHSESFWMTLKFLETLADFLNTVEGKTLFASEQSFSLFQAWIEKISLAVFIGLPRGAFHKLDGILFRAMQFMLDKEEEVGTNRMSQLARVFFDGARAVAEKSPGLHLNQTKYMEIWDEWINIPLDQLQKDFDALNHKKSISPEREHHLFYLTNDDVDLEKIEEVRPFLAMLSSTVLAEEDFKLSRFYAHFLEGSEEAREQMIGADLRLEGLRSLKESVGNALSLETALSLLRNSINEQSVDAYVFIRELIQNSLDASRNAMAFVIVNAIQEKDLPLDWTSPEVHERLEYKIRQWIEHFRKDPESFIEEIGQSSLESSQNAFAFGLVGRILATRLSVDWREPGVRTQTVAALEKWIQEFENDPEKMVNLLLTIAADEAMARFLIQKAQAAGIELKLKDTLELRLQLAQLVNLEELGRRFKLPQLPHILRIADAIRRKYMEVELFKSSNNDLILSFNDAVGMDLKQILQFLLVPGVSSKPSRDPHADGRFGIGFLTALKDSSEVEVISSRGREIAHIYFHPIRNEDRTVRDVDVKISIKKNPESFRGTRILWKSRAEKFPLVAAYLKSKVNEYAGTVSPAEMVIRWQQRVLNEPLDILGKKDIRGLGTLTWYESSQNRKVLTRRGMKVQSLTPESDIFRQTPRRIVENILKSGVVIELPRRTPLTRSRDDISSKEQFLSDLQKANAAIALEVAMKSFLDGSSQLALEMLPHDYLKGLIKDRRYQPRDPQILQDAASLEAGRLIDMRPYIQDHGSLQERFQVGQRLVQLITVLPIMEDSNGGPRLSLLDLVNRLDLGEGQYNAAFLEGLSDRGLAQSLKGAFEEVRQQRIKMDAAEKLFKRPEVVKHNLELPPKIVPGFDTYWAFHEWVSNVAQLLWSMLKRPGTVEILYRIEDSGNYAYGGNGMIFFNLFAAARDIEQWGRFLRGEAEENQIIFVLREFLDTIAHEIAHSIQPPGQGTHHEEFYTIVKDLILMLFSFRNTVQFYLESVKKAGYKGDFRDPIQLEPYLNISNRAPLVMYWRMGKSMTDEEISLLIRLLFRSIREPEKLNHVFWRLAANVPKEGEVQIQDFDSPEAAILFLHANPLYELAMRLELRQILDKGYRSEFDQHLIDFLFPLFEISARPASFKALPSHETIIDRAA